MLYGVAGYWKGGVKGVKTGWVFSIRNELKRHASCTNPIFPVFQYAITPDHARWNEFTSKFAP